MFGVLMSHQISNLGTHPFTVSDFRDHMRLETTDDDTTVTRTLDAAVRAVERWTGLMTRTADVVQECSYMLPPFRGELSYISSLGTVTEFNPEDDTTKTVTDDFVLLRAYGATYAVLRPRHYIQRNRVFRWSYSVGPLNPLPEDLKLCIYGIGATWYENREQIQQNINLTKLPIAYRSMLENFRDGML